jgi:hypothetical protein
MIGCHTGVRHQAQAQVRPYHSENQKVRKRAYVSEGRMKAERHMPLLMVGSIMAD